MRCYFMAGDIAGGIERARYYATEMTKAAPPPLIRAAAETFSALVRAYDQGKLVDSYDGLPLRDAGVAVALSDWRAPVDWTQVLHQWTPGWGDASTYA